MTDTARELIQRLANALHNAAEDVEAWGSYASSYFQEKHDLPGNIAKIHAQVKEARAYLAQAEPDGPAVLDSREPASVTAYPTSSMSELSPAAQAVLDAVVDGALPPFHVIARPMAAAALRAAADQVMPKEWPTIEDYNEYDQGFAAAHIKYRNQILAIAEGFEAQ